MNITKSIYTVLISGIMLAQPTVERPSPDRIIVRDAEYAWIEPFGEVYAVKTGVKLVSTLTWEDGTIEYIVNPTIDFTIHAFSADDPMTPEIDRQQFDIQSSVSVNNQLDWILYNRIVWERRMRDLISDEGLSFFDISASAARVQAMLDTAP